MIPFSKIKNHPAYQTQKAIADHYRELYDCALKVANENKTKWEKARKDWQDAQDLLDAGVGEIMFSNLCIQHLYNELNQIEAMTVDPLTKKSAELAQARHALDKLIHARNLFKN